MENRLIQSQTQKLVLAPQLRQFLKLLELPIFELKQRIEQELMENPTLEEVATNPDFDSFDEASADEKTGADDKIIELIETSDDNVSDGFNDLSLNSPKDLQKKRDYQESVLTKQTTLADFLTWQLSILELTKEEKEIAEEIIGDINDDGYLTSSIEDLGHETSKTSNAIKKVLEKIQSLEPPGVGALSLTETLLLQLKRMPFDTNLAQKIVQNHLSSLEKKQFDSIAKSLNVSSEKIKIAAEQIMKLEPKPGRIFYSEKPNFVVPDASVILNPEKENDFIVEVTRDQIPELKISRMYRQMLKEKTIDEKARVFLKEKVQAGLDLIRSLSQRQTTIKQITDEIVKVQSEFFAKGFSYLKPLRLRDLAEKIGIHESTVSRAIQGKYIVTPFGTIPYKSFFSSKMQMEDGSIESQKSIIERLRHLIHTENKLKPLSDAKLVQLLQKEGVKISRRTVTKYREKLKILPTYLRKA